MKIVEIKASNFVLIIKANMENKIALLKNQSQKVLSLWLYSLYWKKIL